MQFVTSKLVKIKNRLKQTKANTIKIKRNQESIIKERKNILHQMGQINTN